MGTRWNGRPRLVSMLARSCLKATGRKGWPQPFGRFFIGGVFSSSAYWGATRFYGGSPLRDEKNAQMHRFFN